MPDDILMFSTGQALAPSSAQAAGGAEGFAFGDDGLSFSDFLDVVNPLHHIPFVGSIYRRITGDTIAPGARLVGGGLYGGGIGLLSAATGMMVEEAGITTSNRSELFAGTDLTEDKAITAVGFAADPSMSPSPLKSQQAASAYEKAARNSVNDHFFSHNDGGP